MSEDLRVAFIGLGKMSAGIARNIQKAGFPLTVYNRTASKTQPFIRQTAPVRLPPLEPPG